MSFAFHGWKARKCAPRVPIFALHRWTEFAFHRWTARPMNSQALRRREAKALKSPRADRTPLSGASFAS
jgi:hypothetical protein